MNGQALEALALAEYETAFGRPTADTRRLVSLFVDEAEGLNPVEELMLALACKRLGLNDQAERLAAKGKDRPIADVMTASFRLQLGDVDDAVRYLLTHRKGKGWGTTMESAYAVLGLASLLERKTADRYAAPGRIVVRVDGEVAKEIALPGNVDAKFDGRISIPEPKEGWHERVVIELSFDGEGTAFYTAALEAQIGGENPKPENRGLRIERAYFEQVGDGWKPVTGRIRPGSTVLVHLAVRSPETREYVMITDPRPDGFEPVDLVVTKVKGRARLTEGLSDLVDLGAGWQDRVDRFRRDVRGDRARESEWAKALLQEIIRRKRFQPRTRVESLYLPEGIRPDSMEHRDDRSIFFVSSLRKGTTHLYYLARAEFTGDMHVLPASAEPMYEPEVYGSGREARFSVVDESSRPVKLMTARGVEGLLSVIELLDRVDADELIARIPSNPRIGDLLMRVMNEEAFRVWLRTDTEPKGTLGERIEDARSDLATRALCDFEQARSEWLPVIEEAMADESWKRILKGAGGTNVDNAFLWASEDRAVRLRLLAAAQRLRSTARVKDGHLRPVTVAEIVKAASPSDPVRWKLSQRGRIPAGTLKDVVDLLARDLDLKVKLMADPELKTSEVRGRVSTMLDRILGPAKLFYVVRGDTVLIGPLDRIMK